jgi:two-component system osmolarity sensor histidine kinase EnvZ
MADWMPRRLPRSLYARGALILLLPVVALLAVVSVSFVQRYYEDVSRQMTGAVALELAYLAAHPGEARRLGAALEMDVAVPATPGRDARRPWDLAGRAAEATLREKLPNLIAVDQSVPKRVTVWLQTPQGPLEVGFSRRRVAAANPHQLLVLAGVMGLLLTAVAAVFLRNQLRPIRRLAEAATAYGRGHVVPYRPGGAVEVRAAGAAFLDMRARIERQTQARLLMLAGVGHDLRTPLTRLRLGLSLLPDDEGLTRDVDDMARMVDGFLDWARGDAQDEREPTDLAALLRAEVATRPGVVALTVEGEGPGAVVLGPLAVRRALSNLLDNAQAYGARVLVTLAWGERSARVTVEDDGPGIPPERREEALRPFARLDDARNQTAPARGSASPSRPTWRAPTAVRCAWARAPRSAACAPTSCWRSEPRAPGATS